MFKAIKAFVTNPKVETMKAMCPHKAAYGPGSAIVKHTEWDRKLYAETGEFKVVDRVAYCVICGKRWEGIKDWKTFTPSPGNPVKPSQVQKTL